MPIVGVIAKAVLPLVVREIIERTTDRTTALRIENAVASDPKAVNELNGEAPYQSRVAVGSVVSAIGIVVPTVARLAGWDIDGNAVVQFLNAVIILWGALYALYGRFRGGLKPLFSGKD